MPAKASTKPSKIDIVLKFLHRPKGATINQLQKTTGWKPHSVRTALTGLRKKGHEIERNLDARGVSAYRVIKGV